VGHSYCVNFVHCVFSTKDRADLIPPALLEKLWAYVHGICRHDNVQLLANRRYSESYSPADFPSRSRSDLSEVINRIKSNSSRWLGEHANAFAWQEGYGAFSVGASQLTTVKEYIRKQEAHHRKRNFEEEFTELLRRHGVSFDPKYIYG
jgi:putative transposase